MDWAKWKRPSTYLCYLLLLILVIFLVFPVFWVLVTSLKTDAQTFAIPLIFWPRPATLQNYVDVFSGGELLTYMKNSLIIAIPSVVISLFFAICAAYGFARFTFPGSRAALSSILLLRMIPGIMFYIPYFLMITGMGLLNTHTGVIICMIPGNTLFATWILQGFFRTVPVEIEEAAEIDGLGVLRRLLLIVLLVSAPAIVTAMLFTFLGSWNEYLLSSTLLRDSALFTMPMGIEKFSSAVNERIYWGKIMANAAFYLLPVLIFTFVSQKGLVSGLSAGAVKA